MGLADLPFPKSLPEFMKLFQTDADCGAYLELCRWPHGFVCPHCASKSEPYRFEARPGVLRCRGCKRDISLTADTVMERTHTPLSTWFWGAYLVSSITAGMSAVQFQRQLGLGRYETAFQLLHKLRAAMVRSDADQIGGVHTVELDEVWIGGRTRGEGRGSHHKTLVVGAVEVRHRAPPRPDPFGAQTKAIPRRGGLYAGRLRLKVVPDRKASNLVGFARDVIAPGTDIITDDWAGYSTLKTHDFKHKAVAERGDPSVAEEWLPLIHLVFSNLKAWLLGIHHSVGPQHLQAYLNEFVFRFNRRFYPFHGFRSLLGIGAVTGSPTYEELYSGEWKHPVAVAAGG
jgi:hypothetical protein